MDYRKADFILEREQGLPAMLIELESPAHRVLTRKSDLTKEANHAQRQIAEWVTFIQSDTKRNAAGNLNYLSRNLDRLVIIGRGLEHSDTLINTPFGGTLFWTYDMLIEEAKIRLNQSYLEQCNLVGLPAHTLFHNTYKS